MPIRETCLDRNGEVRVKKVVLDTSLDGLAGISLAQSTLETLELTLSKNPKESGPII